MAECECTDQEILTRQESIDRFVYDPKTQFAAYCDQCGRIAPHNVLAMGNAEDFFRSLCQK